MGRKALLGIVAIGSVVALAVGGFVAFDAYVPRDVQEVSECVRLDEGGCAVVVVRRHRVLPPEAWLEVRGEDGAVTRESPLPGAGDIVASAAPELYQVQLRPIEESGPELPTDEWESGAPPPPEPSWEGTCVVGRADGRVRLCTEPDGDVEHALVLSRPIGGQIGGMLLEVLGPPPRSVRAYPLGHADAPGRAWASPIDPRWDPAGSVESAWLIGYVARDGSIDGAGLRIGERYFDVDLESGAVVLASPEDATSVCTEGRYVAAGVGSELRVSRVDRIAFRTVASPGPGVIGGCRLAFTSRRDEPIVSIDWCESLPGGSGARHAEDCRTFEVDAALELVPPEAAPADALDAAEILRALEAPAPAAE